MANIEDYLDRWTEADKHITAVRDMFSNGPMTFCISEIVNCHKSLFDRFCPFKVGDRVQLAKTPKIDGSSGWAGSKHFLKKGARAFIRERGYSEGQFTFVLVFDEDSWLDLDQVIHKREGDRKGGYTFSEKIITRER
jgi:hypothetical protein